MYQLYFIFEKYILYIYIKCIYTLIYNASLLPCYLTVRLLWGCMQYTHTPYDTYWLLALGALVSWPTKRWSIIASLFWRVCAFVRSFDNWISSTFNRIRFWQWAVTVIILQFRYAYSNELIWEIKKTKLKSLFYLFKTAITVC